MDFFDVNSSLFTAWGYNVSYLEFFGMISGIVAVVLSSLANVWSWPIGIINVVLSFFLFYQVQLYPDMFLQIFFFVTNVMGWYRWLHPNAGEADRKKELKVTLLPFRSLVLILFVCCLGTFLMARFAQQLHVLAPALFHAPSAFPYIDSFIMVMSIAATFLMIQKKVECWVVWLVVDMVATYLYFIKDIKLYSILYFVFCFIAAYGIYFWLKEYKREQILPNL